MTFVPFVQGTGLAGWTMLSRTRETQQATFERSPLFARDVAAFRERIETIQTVDDLMNDRTLLRVSLGAFGLDEDLPNRAFIRKVLESDMDDPEAFANRLNDKRYSALARTFGFATEGGPQLRATEPLFAGVSSPDELLSNGTALRSALRRFGLERDEGNVFFLQKVLESDLSDPRSFVNRLGDPKYVAFRKAFDFDSIDAPGNRATDFYLAFKDKVGSLNSAGDLLRDPDLVKAAVAFFDLPSDNPTRLRLALESDPTNPASFVNQLDDRRYVAFSEAFRFGWPDMDRISDPDVLLGNPMLRANALELFNLSDAGDTILRDALTSDLDDPASFVNQPDYLYLRDFVDAFQNGWPEETTKAQRFVEAYGEGAERLKSSANLVFNLDLYDATVDIFGLADRARDRIFIQRVLDSDASAPTSMANLLGDERLGALSRAFDFGGAGAGRSYPAGFADAIVERYSDRQFERQIGEVDPTMRLALAFERELTEAVNASSSNNARWFTVMGTPPLRSVFETAFQLPSSFGTLDLDRQLEDFKTRSSSAFGTSDLRDLLEPDRLDEVRRRFLALSQLSPQVSGLGGGASILQTLYGR